MQPNEESQGPQDPDQEHPAHEAHGGSMAPDVVDDTGHEQPTEEEQ